MLGFLGVFAGSVSIGWVGDEEGILLIAGGVLLGDEEGVEVPEAGLDIPSKFSQECALKSGRIYRFVGISSKPISKKICRNSCRTLFTIGEC